MFAPRWAHSWGDALLMRGKTVWGNCSFSEGGDKEAGKAAGRMRSGNSGGLTSRGILVNAFQAQYRPYLPLSLRDLNNNLVSHPV